MSEPRSTIEPEMPCVYCGTPLHDPSNETVRFCFECGAPVVPELVLPDAPSSALDELRTAAFSPVSIRPNGTTDDDPGLQPGQPIEIESLGLELAIEEIPISLDDDDADEDSVPEAPGRVADPHGTVVSMAPERPMPFWPAPPKGETVIAPPPSSAAG